MPGNMAVPEVLQQELFHGIDDLCLEDRVNSLTQVASGLLMACDGL